MEIRDTDNTLVINEINNTSNYKYTPPIREIKNNKNWYKVERLKEIL